MRSILCTISLATCAPYVSNKRMCLNLVISKRVTDVCPTRSFLFHNFPNVTNLFSYLSIQFMDVPIYLHFFTAVVKRTQLPHRQQRTILCLSMMLIVRQTIGDGYCFPSAEKSAYFLFSPYLISNSKIKCFGNVRKLVI